MQFPIGFLSAMLLLATSASAEVIWRGDFETGTTAQWRGAPKTDSIKVIEATTLEEVTPPRLVEKRKPAASK